MVTHTGWLKTPSPNLVKLDVGQDIAAMHYIISARNYLGVSYLNILQDVPSEGNKAAVSDSKKLVRF